MGLSRRPPAGTITRNKQEYGKVTHTWGIVVDPGGLLTDRYDLIIKRVDENGRRAGYYTLSSSWAKTEWQVCPGPKELRALRDLIDAVLEDEEEKSIEPQ